MGQVVRVHCLVMLRNKELLNKNLLIIFVKYPKEGFVKTRLAKDIGETQATRLYRSFVENIIENTKSNNYKQVFFHSPYEEKSNFKQWLGKEACLVPQEGSDLGERLINAFEWGFDSGAKKIIVIGSDAPFIGSLTINKAISALDEASCVIGPASDGGYYLLGLSQKNNEIFKNINWSTDKVYEQTISAIKSFGLSCAELDENFDVDKKNDLLLLNDALAKNPDFLDNNLKLILTEINKGGKSEN